MANLTKQKHCRPPFQEEIPIVENTTTPNDQDYPGKAQPTPKQKDNTLDHPIPRLIQTKMSGKPVNQDSSFQPHPPTTHPKNETLTPMAWNGSAHGVMKIIHPTITQQKTAHFYQMPK